MASFVKKSVNIEGKVFLVTGGAAGVGAGIVRALLAENARTATVNSTLKAIDVMGVGSGGSGGTVVNISSLLALKIGTHFPVHAATKTAVLQFSMCMGTQENSQKTQVRILTVCLGPTDTALVHRSNFDKGLQVTDYGSTADIRQKVESAVNGIIEVINEGESGSTWIVEDDKPAYDFTEKMVESFQIVSRSDCGCYVPNIKQDKNKT